MKNTKILNAKNILNAKRFLKSVCKLFKQKYGMSGHIIQICFNFTQLYVRKRQKIRDDHFLVCIFDKNTQ